MTAYVRIVSDLCVELGNLTLEDALAKARGLKVTDIVDFNGHDVNDFSITVTGVFSSE
jgi:hypothetical protein